MVTLKIIKAILPVCDVKNQNRVSLVSGKLTTLGLSFSLKYKLNEKENERVYFFQWKITLRYLKLSGFVASAFVFFIYLYIFHERQVYIHPYKLKS